MAFSQGRDEEGKVGTIPRASNHYGSAESLRVAPKSPNNVNFWVKHVFFMNESVVKMLIRVFPISKVTNHKI